MSIEQAAASEIAPASISLEPVPESSRAARRFVSSVLADEKWESVRETAVLLTSELVTNSLVHAASPADITVFLGEEATISVRDADTGPLVTKSPSGELEEGGRGLLMVDRLSDRWGTEHAQGRKTVWFCLRPVSDRTESITGVAGVADAAVTTASGSDLPMAVVADRRLSILILDRDLEMHLTPRDQITEILRRAVTALDAAGAVIDPDEALGGPLTVGSASGQPLREPLEVGGESYGHLTVFCDRQLSEEEEAFVRLAAQRLALSLASNRLLNAARKRHADIQLLAEATELLAGSTSVPHVLSLAVQITVPELAEWAAAYVLDEQGRLRRITAVHAQEGLLDGVLAVLDTDQELSRFLASVGPRDEVARLPRALVVSGQPYQSMVVPLFSRGETSGLLLLGRGEPPDPPTHLAIRELSRRIGLALDNARLHEQVASAASALKASLVPPHLPTLARLELAARYHAATPTVAVGGDFFDVFQLDDGSVILAIGDVCGKGPSAAAIARTSRDVMRLLLDDGWPVDAALRRLNRALQTQPLEERFCTVAVARYRPADGGGLLSVCLAGHPPPILVRGSGTAEPIGAPGGILGVLADSDLALTEVECDLADDDSLVLYTDGVTEARSGIELFGSDRLEALLRSLAGAGPQRLADSVHEAAAKFSANNLRDDLAVLVARSIPLSS